MSYIGSTKIGKMFLGSTEIAKAYLGSDLVFQKGGGPAPSPLPAGYTELEYLSNHNSAGSPNAMAFINPGVSAQTVGRYVTNMKYTGSNGWGNFGDGCVYIRATPRFYMMAGVISTNLTTPKWGVQFAGDSSEVKFPTTFTQDFHSIDMNMLTGKAKLDDANEISFTSGTPRDLPIYIFNRSVNSGYGSGANYKYGSKRKGIQIYDRNGELIRNLIPAKNSLGVSGMYDTVNSVFYTSPNGSHFDQDGDYAGALQNWTLQPGNVSTATYSDGVIAVKCNNTTDLNGYYTWAADIKTTPWSAVNGKTIKVRIKTNSITDGLFAIGVHQNASITSLANQYSKRATLANLTLAADGYYEQTFECDIANFNVGSLTPGADATFGVICFSRSTSNYCYIYDVQIYEMTPDS